MSQSKIGQADERFEKGASRIDVVPANPGAFAGIDNRRVVTYQTAVGRALVNLRKAAQTNKVSQTVVAVAGKQQATEVLPDLPEEEQVDALRDQILKITRAYEEDPVLVWRERDEKLARKTKELNQEQFSTLHYTTPGTDIIIGLSKNRFWKGAGNYNARGEKFIANVPTEKVFTASDGHCADRYISSTKSLSYVGTVISGMKFIFKGGKIVDPSAKQGEDVLEKLPNTGKGTRRLGEVAPVPDPSPISQFDIIFFNILFGENASNHLALRSAYTLSMKGGVEMSNEELTEAGLNRSQTYIDSTVGSGKMDIDGVREDGSAVSIFHNGDWA